MTTLLFFDDNVLAVRNNVRRGIGRPKLMPESIFKGDPKINLAWSYPGVFHIEEQGVYRMVYHGKTVHRMNGKHWVKLVAESKDGLHWREADTTKITKIPNRRFAHQAAEGGEWCGSLVDHTADDEHRYKKVGEQEIWSSPDALKWSPMTVWRKDAKVDMAAYPFYCDVYGQHFITARRSMGDRRICIYQTDDWHTYSEPTLVLPSDGADPVATDSYGLPVFQYDGWYLGLLWLYHGAQQFQGSSPYKSTGGKVDCQLAYSLNGLAWQRTQREPFIPNGDPDDIDCGCVYPSSVLRRDDLGEIWFYASTSTWEHGPVPRGTGSIATYKLRKDGFAYLESEAGLGQVSTKPLYWRGGELHLNIQSGGGTNKSAARYAVSPANEHFPSGYLMNGARVQINDYRGNALKGYTFEDSRVFCGDSLDWRPTWKSGKKLSQLAGKDIQVAIQLNNTRLYAIRGDFQLMAPQHWRDFYATPSVPPKPTPGFDLP